MEKKVHTLRKNSSSAWKKKNKLFSFLSHCKDLYFCGFEKENCGTIENEKTKSLTNRMGESRNKELQ